MSRSLADTLAILTGSALPGAAPLPADIHADIDATSARMEAEHAARPTVIRPEVIPVERAPWDAYKNGA